jgi:hypothetical protein
MTARSTKRQVVLARVAGPGHGEDVWFAAPGRTHEMFWSAADFRALGEPERITITIEAGERLDEETSDV